MSADRQDRLDRCVEIVYDQFIDPQPHNFYITSDTIRQIAQEELGVDREEAADIATLFNDRYIRERPTKNTDLLNIDGIKRAAELGKDVPIDGNLQDRILDFLYDAYIESPSNPTVSRAVLQDEFEESETSVDLNTYILKLKRWVETGSHVGIGDDGYRTLELTESARSQLS